MKPCFVVLLALAALGSAAPAQESLDSSVARFYARRWGQPAWVFANGITSQADRLLTSAARSSRDGLDSADYLTPALDSLLHRHLSPDDAWRLDSLLTRAFLLYARDLSRGRVEPAAVDTQWTAAPRALDLVAILDRAADDREAEDPLAALAPPQAGYQALRAALQRYRYLAQLGPWPTDLGRRLAAERYDTTAGITPVFSACTDSSPTGSSGPPLARRWVSRLRLVPARSR